MSPDNKLVLSRMLYKYGFDEVLEALEELRPCEECGGDESCIACGGGVDIYQYGGGYERCARCDGKGRCSECLPPSKAISLQ